MTDLWQEKVYRKAEEIITRHICDEVILVPVKGKLGDMEQIFSLDAVSEYIWNNLDGKKNMGEIHAGILDQFNVENDVANADLNEFVADLVREGLVEEVRV